MRHLCDNGDGKVVHARGLCDNCYHRALYHNRRSAMPGTCSADSGSWSWPGFAVSRYTWRGISCNQLPAVWAAEDAQVAAATTVAKASA